MAQVLVLEEMDGQVFKVAQGAQIGRSPGLCWCVPERRQPEEWGLLEVAVQVTDAPETMSRNHCGVIPDGDGFAVVDLNSMNGTTLNGRQLQPGKRYRIGAGDTLAMASYRLVARGCETSVKNHHAIIVGGVDAFFADLFVHGASELVEVLSRRGFESNVTVLPCGSRSEVLEAIGRLERVSTADSHVLFYFAGGGSERGLACLSPRGEETLTPADLFGAFSRVRGKKALLLDAPAADVFVKAKGGLPSETLVVASTDPVQPAYFGVGPDGSTGTIGRGLVRFLQAHPHRIDLSLVSAWLEGDGLSISSCHAPRVAGCRYTIQSIATCLPFPRSPLYDTHPGGIDRPTTRTRDHAHPGAVLPQTLRPDDEIHEGKQGPRP